jgi:hypothetical protein
VIVNALWATPRASAASIQQPWEGYKRKITQFEGVLAAPATGYWGCQLGRLVANIEPAHAYAFLPLPSAQRERIKVRGWDN